jgi:hypothetical protein
MLNEIRPSQFYGELFEGLQEAGWAFPDDLDSERNAVYAEQLDSLDDKEKYSLRRIVFDQYLNKGRALANWYKSQTSVRCQFDLFQIREALTLTSEHLTILPKKAVSYTGASLFSSSTMCDYQDTIGFPQHFWETILNLKPLLESDMALFLPSRIQIDDGGTYKNTIFHFRYEFYENDAEQIYIDLCSESAEKLAKQLFESVKLDWLSGMPTIFLPVVNGLRLEDMVKIRKNDPTSFVAYQTALKTFLRQLVAPASEERLHEAMQYVSDSVISYNRYLSKEAKGFQDSGYDVAVGLVACLLVLLVPSYWGAAIGALFGSKSVYEGLRYLSRGTAITSGPPSDFAFAWKLAAAAKNFP